MRHKAAPSNGNFHLNKALLRIFRWIFRLLETFATVKSVKETAIGIINKFWSYFISFKVVAVECSGNVLLKSRSASSRGNRSVN